MSRDLPSHVAYAEDGEDDSGSEFGVKPGTRTYARSEAPSVVAKERPNTGKSRIDRRPTLRASESSSSEDLDDSDDDDPAKQNTRRHSHMHDLELREREWRRREKLQDQAARIRAERAARAPQPLKKTRPSPLKHSATQPLVQQGGYRRGRVEDPSFYGLQQPAVNVSRPRASTRPASYYAGQPPRQFMPGMGWTPGRPLPGPGPGPMPFPVGTYPPPQQQMYPPPSPGARDGPPLSPGGIGGYFDAAMSLNNGPQMRNRFDMRPQSAMGFGSPSMGYPPPVDPRGPPPPSAVRRPSVSRARKDTEDRKKMPPPDFIPSRPQSAALPPSTPFRPPQRPPSRPQPSRPPTSHRRSIGGPPRGFDDDDFRADDGLFHDISPQATREQRRQALARTQRALVPRYDDTEEEDEDDNEFYPVAPVDYRSRRGSAYGARALGGGGVSLEDDRIINAMRYQDEQAGGTKLALTADALRKVNRPRGVPSSRSTRSSASRDDSDYKRSNTTGLTRSSSNNPDDLSINTIKLSGNARVWMGGAEIACDGGEITVTSRAVSGRGGSDHTSTTYQLEDNRSRFERKALPQRSRSRAPSQSDSQSRAYLPGHAPYEPAFADHYF